MSLGRGGVELHLESIQFTVQFFVEIVRFPLEFLVDYIHYGIPAVGPQGRTFEVFFCKVVHLVLFS